MKQFLISLMLVSVISIQEFAFQATSPPAAKISEQSVNLAGRWHVKFTMMGVEKNLVLVSQAKGVASFLLLDTGPDGKPVADPQPADWSQLTNNRVSFSGEAELQLGTCCREIGTLIFKGKFNSNNSMSGKLIFVTSVDEEESPYKFRSVIGTFNAARVQK
jgi:hypothetical protein